MKLIVDFDDVLFKAGDFKEVVFDTIARYGVSDARARYDEERKKDTPFSLKNFLRTLFEEKKGSSLGVGIIYNEIMDYCERFVNQDLVGVMHKVGKENCYIVSSGDSEYQHDKITKTGLDKLVAKVIVVSGSKNVEIELICKEFPDDEVIFTDDKNIYFDDINRKVCPKLTTVTYDEQGQANLEAKISAGLLAEQKKNSPHFPNIPLR